jgi:hypothetical protein
VLRLGAGVRVQKGFGLAARIAALGLVLMMIGAIVVHARRKENEALPVNNVLLLLALFVVWGRFGPHAF